MKLSDYVHQNAEVDEDIFNHFKAYYQQDKQVTYFEDEWIYRMNSSGGYAFSYEEPDTFYLSIHQRSKRIQWQIGIKLQNIPEDGIVITGSDYQWLKETLEQTYFPRCFMDNDVATGEYIYEVFLKHGNNFD